VHNTSTTAQPTPLQSTNSRPESNVNSSKGNKIPTASGVNNGYRMPPTISNHNHNHSNVSGQSSSTSNINNKKLAAQVSNLVSSNSSGILPIPPPASRPSTASGVVGHQPHLRGQNSSKILDNGIKDPYEGSTDPQLVSVYAKDILTYVKATEVSRIMNS
jgi:hypothetical protein